ncbi:MAG: hypothetical protein V4584_01910 [Verrucomicrobiota bacterium]
MKTNRGFALVISLLMMVMLVILGVGLLSLGTISLRSASAERGVKTAEENARLAVMLALGELQLTLGDDRRVTANASIFETASVSVARPQLVGVWDSTTTTGRNNPNSAPAIPYSSWKSGTRFKSWLVSSADPEAKKTVDFGKAPAGGTNVGLFHIKKDGFDLRAETVKIAKSGRTASSSLAYAVVQEGDKANISLPGDVYQNSSDSIQAPMHSNLALSGIAKQPDGGWDERAAKLVSLNQTVLDTGYAVAKESTSQLGPDYTVWSRAVIADVANGGLKTDLNLAFELPDANFAKAKWDTVTNPFRNGTAEAVIYGPTANTQPPSIKTDYGVVQLNQTFAIGAAPTYDMLRSHYTTYKHLYQSGGTVTAFQRPQVNRVWKTKLPIYSAPRGSETGIIPVLDRMMYLIHIWADTTGTPWVVLAPVITLWNPYNVAIESKGYVAYPWMDMPIGVSGRITKGSKVTTFGMPFSWLVGSEKVKAGEGRQSDPYFFCNLTVDGTNNPTKSLRLEPGEIRVFVPKEQIPRWLDRKSADTAKVWNMMPADTNLLKLGGGIGLDTTKGVGAGPVEKLASGDKLSMSFEFQPNSFHYFTTLEDANRIGNPANKGTIINEVQLFQGGSNKTITSPDYTHVAGSKPLLVGVLETYHRTAAITGELSDIMQTVNARQRYINSAVSGARFLAGPNYNSSIRAGTTLAGLGLQVTPDGRRAYYGGSNEPGLGRDKVVQFDTSRQPVISLGSFQNADLSDTAFSPSNQFGNSWASPYLSRNKTGRAISASTVASVAINPALNIYDHSWLLNDALWDKYFMSSIAPVVKQSSGTGSVTVYDRNMVTETKDLKAVIEKWVESPTANPLRNSRHIFHSGGSSNEEIKDKLVSDAGCRHAAEHMLVNGPFNVNSTSVPAWTAVLTSLRGGEFETVDAAGNIKTHTSSEATPVPRLSTPTGTAEDPWNGFRELTDAQIKKLAQKIVDEVRSRGPFQSLSEFVNRRVDSSALGLKGALQSAIDLSGINDAKRMGTYISSSYTNPENLPQPYTGTGLASWLTQADLLVPLAPIITVRSDTFRIRGYGEVKDANGVVTARATCEAVVQRMPEWVDPADEPLVLPASLTSVANRTFGRRFEVVSFRMLPRDELNSL